MQKLFLVVEKGVYRHRIMGVFTDFAGAAVRGKVTADESDGHHDYEVYMGSSDCAIDDVETLLYFRRPYKWVDGKRQFSKTTLTWRDPLIMAEYTHQLPVTCYS